MAVDGADRGYPTPCRRSSGICNDRVWEGVTQSVGRIERKFFERSRRATLPPDSTGEAAGYGVDEIVSALQAR